MSDKDLCELFGISLEEVEREVSAVESGDLSAFDFSKTMMGRPMESEKLVSFSLKIPQSRMLAIERVAKEQGLTKSEFVRQAIDRELVALG